MRCDGCRTRVGLKAVRLSLVLSPRRKKGVPNIIYNTTHCILISRWSLADRKLQKLVRVMYSYIIYCERVYLVFKCRICPSVLLSPTHSVDLCVAQALPVASLLAVEAYSSYWVAEDRSHCTAVIPRGRTIRAPCSTSVDKRSIFSNAASGVAHGINFTKESSSKA